MKITIERPLFQADTRTIAELGNLINELAFCENENEIRHTIKMLERREELSRFSYGYGAHHFWVAEIKNKERFLIVEF